MTAENNNRLTGQSRRIMSVDALRTLAAIFVVFIHAPFPGDLGVAVKAMARFAVPVFFIISGYGLYNADIQTVFKRIKRQLLLTVSTLGLYHLFAGYAGGQHSPFGIKQLLQLIVFQEMTFPTHVWFLFAGIYCYLLAALLIKVRLLDKIAGAVPFLLIVPLFIGLILPRFNVVLPEYCYRNAYFMGFPFMMLGYIINRSRPTVERLKTPMLIALTAVGLISQIIEQSLFGVSSYLYFGSVLSATAMFMLAVKCPAAPRLLSEAGKRYTTAVYAVHIIVNRVLIYALEACGIHRVLEYAVPILVVILSFAFAVVYKMAEKFIIDKVLEKFGANRGASV